MQSVMMVVVTGLVGQTPGRVAAAIVMGISLHSGLLFKKIYNHPNLSGLHKMNFPIDFKSVGSGSRVFQI